MNCDELVELVTAYLEGALSPADTDRVATHLAGCDGCATYVKQFRTTVDALGRLPSDATELPATTRADLLARFRSKHA
jgi:anti-sigma factor RsiW